MELQVLPLRYDYDQFTVGTRDIWPLTSRGLKHIQLAGGVLNKRSEIGSIDHIGWIF